MGAAFLYFIDLLPVSKTSREESEGNRQRPGHPPQSGVIQGKNPFNRTLNQLDLIEDQPCTEVFIFSSRALLCVGVTFLNRPCGFRDRSHHHFHHRTPVVRKGEKGMEHQAPTRRRVIEGLAAGSRIVTLVRGTTPGECGGGLSWVLLSIEAWQRAVPMTRR